jgi:hypothetical protein
MMAKFSKKLAIRLAALGAATVGLSGCMYDAGLGLGYADQGYYDCDPYAAWDSYYACDSGYGFYNIGFGGGWYENYWYPGYGYYIFDNVGRRYTMRDHHRHYWGNQRQRWSREHRDRDGRWRDGYGRGGRDRDRDGRGGRGGRHGYDRSGNSGQGADQPIGWPERNGGRVEEAPGRAVPVSRDRDGRGRNGEGRSGGWRNPGNQAPNVDATPTPQPAPRAGRGNGGGRGEGRGGWQQRPSNNGAQERGSYQPPAAPRAERPAPAPRAERPAPAPSAPRAAPPSRPSRNAGDGTQPE